MDETSAADSYAGQCALFDETTDGSRVHIPARRHVEDRENFLDHLRHNVTALPDSFLHTQNTYCVKEYKAIWLIEI
jgi:hypothetical protein